VKANNYQDSKHFRKAILLYWSAINGKMQATKCDYYSDSVESFSGSEASI
jgi:hypothetical protein